MRSLIRKGATVAIIVMASGAAAGQKQSGPIPATLITPSPKQAPPMPTFLNHTAVVDRILSFDANGDDRIARDELPERMEGLVSRGDKNQDGFLTRDEVFPLVDTRSPARRIQRFSARGDASLAEIIADLKLPPVTHDRAMAIVKEHTVSRNINDPASDELYAAMRELLDDEDYENFVAAATRLRNTPRVFVGGIAGGVVGTPAPPPR
jgi:hypothetical protein